MTHRDARSGVDYLDLEAAIGITKHMGGAAATTELLSLCRIAAADTVLNVGCGIGIESAYIAKTYGCHVVGIDISEKMIEWAHRRAREDGVGDKVALLIADVLSLPFLDDHFDVVFGESVLIFVEDKARAIRECVRVTRPGGYVALNEGFWFKQPTPETVARVKDAIGPAIPPLETWQALWEASGLQDRVVRLHDVRASQEIKRRVQWIGWSWLMRAWGRALRLCIANPAARHSIKKMFTVPWGAYQHLGYGLFVGRK